MPKRPFGSNALFEAACVELVGPRPKPLPHSRHVQAASRWQLWWSLCFLAVWISYLMAAAAAACAVAIAAAGVAVPLRAACSAVHICCEIFG